MIVTDAMVGAALRGFDMTNPESFEGMRKAIARAMTPDPAARMGEALLPCPFCGHAPRTLRTNRGQKVVCPNGDCGGETLSWSTKDRAIAAWNKRAAPGWIACSERMAAAERVIAAARTILRPTVYPSNDDLDWNQAARLTALHNAIADYDAPAPARSESERET
jgi:hypothetical protein